MDKQINEILAFIGGNPTGVSFYQIVRGFGFPDAPYDLNEILRNLINERLAEVHQPEAGVNAQYVITANGVEAILKGTNWGK